MTPDVAYGLRRRALTALALASALVAPRAAAQEPARDPPTATEGQDFRVYGRWGAASSVSEIVATAIGSEVLLVGEEHDDMPGHALEAILFEAAAMALEATGTTAGAAEAADAPTRKVVLSLEMFERDVQYVVDEYLEDLISESHFLSSARPWDDYDIRYRPLVEAAKRLGAPVIAANAPRRYVNRVTREGPASLESLSDLARGYLPPLPYPGPSDPYREQWNALMAAAMAEVEQDAPADSVPDRSPSARDGTPDGAPEEDDGGAGAEHAVPANAIHSQALWDASMGHAITSALVEHLGALVIHFAGSFHVANGTGIPERIEDYRPGTRVTTVVMTKVDDLDAWSEEEHADLADFVVLTQKPSDTAHPGGGS
jgi:uncharacterized iron-regulated protein